MQCDHWAFQRRLVVNMTNLTWQLHSSVEHITTHCHQILLTIHETVDNVIFLSEWYKEKHLCTVREMFRNAFAFGKCLHQPKETLKAAFTVNKCCTLFGSSCRAAGPENQRMKNTARISITELDLSYQTSERTFIRLQKANSNWKYLWVKMRNKRTSLGICQTL